jgi:hypothetical protein
MDARCWIILQGDEAASGRDGEGGLRAAIAGTIALDGPDPAADLVGYEKPGYCDEMREL